MLFVGNDWAEDHHDVEVLDQTGRRLARAKLPEGVAGMTRLHELVAEHLDDDAHEYERLFLEEIDDVLDLVAHAEDDRTDCSTIRPHEALAWNRPVEVYTGQADPRVPNFPETEILPTP